VTYSQRQQPSAAQTLAIKTTFLLHLHKVTA
jgi:hypothetical protein